MIPDSSHARRKILRRAVDAYDAARARATCEWLARQDAIGDLSRLLCMSWENAAILLADTLARRAANKLEKV
jgi:hypothetical protein